MAVSVPASDIYGTQLQAQVTALQALVTANANPAVQTQLVVQLDQAQQALVQYLMANALDRAPNTGNANLKPSYLTASGVLSNGTINT